jgi:hypothetical protein
MSADLPGWELLRHGGLLLDPPRLREFAKHTPRDLGAHVERDLRKRITGLLDDGADLSEFVGFFLEQACGFGPESGRWLRGPSIGSEHSRVAITKETIKPRHLWLGPNGAMLPVFIDTEKRLGIGRGRRAVSHALQWLRASGRRLALVTNGRQWRVVFAGLDFDAYCEADAELFFEEGAAAPQLLALRSLLQPGVWTPPSPDGPAPLEQAVLDSRKGQAELSAVLGERVREAVEVLVEAHAELLTARGADIAPADIYRAAVRIIMRMVVVLFAESRDLLPRDNPVYHSSYGLNGLIEELEKTAHRSGGRLARSHAAWPRVLALFRLVFQGASHPALPVPQYGGELFAPGDLQSADGLSRALALFESGCFERQCVSDRDVHRILEKITRTKVRIRQGRSSTWVPTPVDFSDLSSEYIGILYEGLLDFELKTAPAGDPVIFLAVGNTPALPLSRLEAMDDRAIAALLENMQKAAKETAPGESGEEAGEGEGDEAEGDPETSEIESLGEDDAGEGGEDEADLEPEPEEEGEVEPTDSDARHTTRTRAEEWARRAVVVGNLVRKPRGAVTPERRLAYEEAVGRKARQLVSRVVLPGEWYLVRWGGTRKGAGTFYTRPGLAVPTVQRTLHPLAYDPPSRADGSPDAEAPPDRWIPKAPEDILALKVCDPACGSGTFLVAALRYLTEALYESLILHDRVSDDPERERAVVRLIEPPAGKPAGAPSPGGPPVPEERLTEELVPCRVADAEFEPRLKALLRRHVVERSLYGVDIDPLAVELARLSLWIETMDRSLPFSFLDHKIKCGNSLVGAWFDTFRHYPVMAFKNREGGDKGHTNGVHFAKDARGKALKAFASGTLKADLVRFLSQPSLFDERDLAQEAAGVHDAALATLARLHELPVHDTAERMRLYRDELQASPAIRQLKEAMDLWCACWFWPADQLELAPLPTSFHAPSADTRALAEHIAAEKRFFHWELEFPDVFCHESSGFDAMLGNPPWDIAKPNSKEFFSNIDPLYRSYGKQEALRKQTEFFADESVERAWLDYNADFRAQSNFIKYAARAFGDPAESEDSTDRFAIARGRDNELLHERWRRMRAGGRGYADAAHPFRHQGSADINLYKLFLETAHALVRQGGRLGFIVPSGLYSDHGTGDLRRLFLDHCRWEWLFGFENREKVFDIDSRFKFNPVIVQKGGRTEAIRAAFMRRALEDWEQGKELTVAYTRDQVERFSPKSRAILEIQSARDLEILEKIYANAVLLGDEGPDGWGVKYSTEFHMTNDSKLFPPRPVWEAKGYRPDEYSRWLLGQWRPIEELWAELGVDPARVVPAEVELEEWLFDSTAGPERRQAEAQFVHGHLLKPGDVARTSWRLRCAQPPYDALPIPRADIPAGIVLSREADAWIREEDVDDVALPLYEGRMIGQFDFSQKGWVSGKGRSAVWRGIPWERKVIEPQYLIGLKDAVGSGKSHLGPKIAYMRVGSSTNSRTTTATYLGAFPAGDSVFFFVPKSPELLRPLVGSGVLSAVAYDFGVRQRLGGLNLSEFVMAETALPRPTPSVLKVLAALAVPLMLGSPVFSSELLCLRQVGLVSAGWKADDLAPADNERTRRIAIFDGVVAALFGLDYESFVGLLADCDLPRGGLWEKLNVKGFWRVDKDKDPELRYTVLALVAFYDLEEKTRACGGDRDAGIEAFLNQNQGEGWMLPERLRLADYGLGHDERAKHPQPVASRLGPRFYDWQLTQSAEESWRECHLHARNLLGEQGYRDLLREIAVRKANPECGGQSAASWTGDPPRTLLDGGTQGRLW